VCEGPHRSPATHGRPEVEHRVRAAAGSPIPGPRSHDPVTACLPIEVPGGVPATEFVAAGLDSSRLAPAAQVVVPGVDLTATATVGDPIVDLVPAAAGLVPERLDSGNAVLTADVRDGAVGFAAAARCLIADYRLDGTVIAAHAGRPVVSDSLAAAGRK